MIRIIYSLDNNNGYLFNNRRQTYDKVALDYIVNTLLDKDSTLWVSDYSKELFNEFEISTNRLEKLDLEKLNDNSAIFVENIEFDIEKVAKSGTHLELVLFKWNKVYPADKKLILNDFYLNNFEVIESKKLIGNVHDSILLERWLLKKNK